MTESEPGTLVTIFLFFGVPIAYIGLGVWTYGAVHKLSRKYGKLQRQAMVSMAAAIFWAPSISMSEGGPGPGLALFTIYQIASDPTYIMWGDLLIFGIAPILVCFFLIFIIRTLFDLGTFEQPSESRPDAE